MASRSYFPNNRHAQTPCRADFPSTALREPLLVDAGSTSALESTSAVLRLPLAYVKKQQQNGALGIAAALLGLPSRDGLLRNHLTGGAVWSSQTLLRGASRVMDLLVRHCGEFSV